MPSIILLHTCESEGTASSNAAYLRNIGAEPHWVFDPRFPLDEAIQMVPYTAPGKALRNLAGGVETNRREADGAAGVDVVQVELVGYASRVADYDDNWYRNLRTFLLGLCADLGVPYRFPKRFAQDYGDARRVRLTNDEWLDPALTGVLGHCHVAENDHWDPGPLDLRRLAPESFIPQEDPDMQLTDQTTAGHTVNDVLLWTLQRANESAAKLDVALARIAALEARATDPTGAVTGPVNEERIAELVVANLAGRLAS
jgi:hypothetical protein